MNKTLISIFALVLVLSAISLSSAVCLNCNQLNAPVQYYQNANGCAVYSPSINYQSYNLQPTYSINKPYSIYPMIQYHQEYRHYEYHEESESKSPESKCNWHMSFYRNC